MAVDMVLGDASRMFCTQKLKIGTERWEEMKTNRENNVNRDRE